GSWRDSLLSELGNDRNFAGRCPNQEHHQTVMGRNCFHGTVSICRPEYIGTTFGGVPLMKQYVLVTAIAFLLSPLGLSSAAAGDTTSGLVGLWRFDEGSGFLGFDSSGLNNTGTLMNSPSWTGGAVGGALVFNGYNQYVRMPNPGPMGYGAVTATAWVKTTSPNEQVFVAYGSDSGTGYPEYFRLNINMNGVNRIGVRSGNGRKSFYAPNITNGAWHHVAIIK